MSFYSRGSSRQGRGRSNIPRGIWQHGRNKKIIFSVHFNVDYEEFNQLGTTSHIFLGSPSIYRVPHQSPLQPHPNIHEIHVQNANDGWEQAPSEHPDGNLGWG